MNGMYGYGMQNRMNPNQQSDPGAFRNVYGVLGGIQSLLHIFTSLVDVLYLLKSFKNLYCYI